MQANFNKLLGEKTPDFILFAASTSALLIVVRFLFNQLKSLQHFESAFCVPILALRECQYPLQERLDGLCSERSRR